MAKITAEFDTNSKELSVSVDGKAVDNIYAFTVDKCYDDDGFCCSLMTLVKDEQNDTRTVTRMVASQSRDLPAIASQAVASVEYPGFVQVVTAGQHSINIPSLFGVE